MKGPLRGLINSRLRDPVHRGGADPLPSGTTGLGILAAYPPPYGGVSVGVQRLVPLLEDRGVDFVVYNLVSASGDGRRVISVCRWRRLWTLLYLIGGRDRAVYLMSDRLIAWVVGAVAARLRRRRIMVRLRNAKLTDWVSRSSWHRFWAGFALRRMTGVISAGRDLIETVVRLGVDARRVHWCPSFLPPVVSPQERDRVAGEIWSFVASHAPVIAANGRVLSYDGQDLYGLDLLVELAGRLKPVYPRVGMVICFWEHTPREDAYLDRLKARARELGVLDNMLFNTGTGVFVPVLERSNLFVRPTNTDGDATSVREALYLGIPAVASDVVQRPAGAILFRSRDLDDLEAKVRTALGRDPATTPPATGLKDEDRRRIGHYLEVLAALAGGRDIPAPPNGVARASETP